jgi:hypothetical protein
MKPCLLLLIVALCSTAIAGETGARHAGVVKNLDGTVIVTRDGRRFNAIAGARLYEKDIIETGRAASIGVILRDDTLVSLGPRSRFVLKRFEFAPEEGRFAFVGRVIRGVAAFLSGQIAKISPESAVVETPDATIGVRGTRFAVRVKGE